MKNVIRVVFLFVMVCAFGDVRAAVQSTMMAQTDATVPPVTILPCTSMGYSVDATLDIPLQTNHVVVFHRTERRNVSSRIGFVITRNTVSAGERWLYTYDTRTMTLISGAILQTAAETYYGTQVIGEVNDNNLYLFRNVNDGSLGCVFPGSQCPYVAKYNFSGTLLGASMGGISTQNIYDVRMNGNSTLVVLYNDGSARKLMTYSVPGANFIGTSGTVGISSAGYFALNGDGGAQYVGYLDALKTVQRVALDSPTVDATGVFSYAGSDITGGIFVIPSGPYVVGESTSVAGTGAATSYLTSSLGNVGTTFQYVNTDGSASARNTFWDATNSRIHSTRIDAGFGVTGNVMRMVAGTGVIEQRFNCSVACLTSTSNATADWVEQAGRLFYATDVAGPIARITRVKVCAVGGPSA